ncbi:MAG: FkbM family methyltransferase [Alphaproteobacteria bacterium]
METQPYGTFAPAGLRRTALAALQRLSLRGTPRRAAAAFLFPREPRLVDATLFGLPFRFKLDIPGDRKALFAISKFDPEERHFIQTCLRPDGVFIDIGAAAGVYSFSVAARRPDATVLAFEPITAVHRRMEFNIALNSFGGRVRAFNVALGDHEGTIAFDLVKGSAATGRSDITVPVETLAGRLAKERITRVDALKIDVEGYEDRVLVAFFDEAPPSLWPGLIVIEHAVTDRWKVDCLKLLDSLDYRKLWRGQLNTVYQNGRLED